MIIGTHTLAKGFFEVEANCQGLVLGPFLCALEMLRCH